MASEPSEPFRFDSETAFILGNGPSLKGVDLKALPGPSFGMNAAYRYWRSIDWRPRYYSCLDLVVGVSHKDAIAELIEEGRIERFLLRANLIEALGEAGRSERVISFEGLASQDDRLASPTITTGSHTTLWAATLGYRKIALLGIDGNYKEIVPGAERRDGIELEVVESGENPNYFFEGYQQPGDRYNIPNPRPGLHKEGWGQAAAVLADEDVQVVNTNPRSDVGYFPFVDRDAAFASGSETRPARLTPPPRETTSEAPPGLRQRLSREGKPLGLLALLCAAALVLAALAGFGLAALVAFALLAGAVFALGALFLLNRRAVTERLARQEAELTGLRERLKALEGERRA